MESFKKYVAEFIGTMVLVTVGCGTAMLVGCDVAGGGYILTALAFGLSIVAMAYSIGNISGCHVNPAVSLAVLISGNMNLADFIGYVCAQILGATAGAGLLKAVFSLGQITDQTGCFGSNGLASLNYSYGAGFLVETILTFIFVLSIVGVTSKKADHKSFGGIVIGLSLTLVHILGINLTGTSVNPARSFGPAIISALNGQNDSLGCLWVFLAAPLTGAVLAALLYKFLEKKPKAQRIPNKIEQKFPEPVKAKADVSKNNAGKSNNKNSKVQANKKS